MDYAKAFTYLPETSENWISKAAMGFVFVLLIPVIGVGLIGLLGWSIAISRGVIRGQQDVLPEWSELAPIFIDGLKLFVVVILWFLPLWVLSIIGAFVDDSTINLIISCCSILFGIPVGLLFLGAYGLLADEKSFSVVLNPVNSWKIVSANWANTIITVIVAVLASFLGSLGSFLCGLGFAYYYSVVGHLYGQFYKEAQMKSAVA